VKKCHKENSQNPTTVSKVWQPPATSIIRVNWDGSINKEAGCIGMGIVARDHAGNFLGAKCIYQQVVVDPKVEEVMAVQFCKERHV
jgi:hypothetical protein